VDYCLKTGERNSVYLEIKRMSEDLSRHESQLLKYAFEDGIEIAVLTNGLLWWLYLPLERGSWQERKFFTIDIRQQEPATAVGHFCDFLSREAVANGSALSNARKVQASRVKKQIILQTMPKAWEQMLQEPDDFLMELLADRIESMCGYRPEMDIIEEFILDFKGQNLNNLVSSSKPVYQSPPKPLPIISEPAAVTGTPLRKLRKTTNSQSRDRCIGIIVQVDTEVITASSVSDFYLQILKFLDKFGYLSKLDPYIPHQTSSTRYLISNTPVHQRGNNFTIPVEFKGHYMEAHKDYKTAYSAIEKLLILLGVEISLLQYIHNTNP
jgi:hypothetical protein